MQELFIISQYRISPRSFEAAFNRFDSHIQPTKYVCRIPVFYIDDNISLSHIVRISVNKKYVYVNLSYFEYYRIPKSVYNKLNPCYHVY